MPAEEKKKEDERLFEEEYAKLKGKTEKKYALIPKFYSKVRCSVNGNSTMADLEYSTKLPKLCVYPYTLVCTFPLHRTCSRPVMTRSCSRSSERTRGVSTSVLAVHLLLPVPGSLAS